MAINDLVGLLTGTSMTQQLPPITSNPQVNILNRMNINIEDDKIKSILTMKKGHLNLTLRLLLFEELNKNAKN